MNSFLSELRQTWRSLRNSPGLGAVSVLSLGLGLGINFTLFTAIGAIFFYEPSVADVERVIAIEPGNNNQFSYLNYLDLRESGIFEAVAGYRAVQLNLRAEAETERVEGLAVSADFFESLGVTLERGRYFGWAEASPERQPRVVVLSHTFWQRRFNADAGVIGREIMLNGEVFSVVGVLPDGYRSVSMLRDPNLYVPLSALVFPTISDRNNGNALNVLARLRPGATREQAQAAVTNLGRRLEQAYPEDNRDMGQPARARPVRGGEFSGSPAQFVAPSVLLMVFGLVLLSGCANVAGLLMARSAHRQREVAIRLAIGARRGQVIRLLLAESFGLAILGAAAGTMLSAWLTGVLNAMTLPGFGPLNLSLEPNAFVGANALVLVAITGVLCGIVPALRATKTNVSAAIQMGESQGLTGRLWLRHAFVVGQVAVCLTLLVLSSLLLRSLGRVLAMDPGFDLDRGVVASVHINADRYTADGGLPLGERLIERLEQLPGVESASFANIVALGGDRSAGRLQVEGGQAGATGARTFLNSVAPRYFAALGIPIVRGRDFDVRDRQGSSPVAIVSEAFAAAYFPGQDALGKRVRRSEEEPYSEIVGIARDHMYGSYGDSSTPVFYAAYAQQPRVSTQIRPVVVHVRTRTAPAAAIREIREVIAQVDATVSADVRTLRDATGAEPTVRRFGARLVSSAGVVGLLLAMIGLYGVMAFAVASRTHELGVRMALGATTRQILVGVLAQGMTLVSVGIAIGTVASLLLSRAAVGLLAGLSPADPVAFGGTALMLIVVGLTASYLPARRAAKVQPLIALRRL